jgi:hypothetical protein
MPPSLGASPAAAGARLDTWLKTAGFQSVTPLSSSKKVGTGSEPCGIYLRAMERWSSISAYTWIKSWLTKEAIILRGVIALILSGTLPGMILGVSLMVLIIIFLYLMFRDGKKNWTACAGKA